VRHGVCEVISRRLTLSQGSIQLLLQRRDWHWIHPWVIGRICRQWTILLLRTARSTSEHCISYGHLSGPLLKDLDSQPYPSQALQITNHTHADPAFRLLHMTTHTILTNMSSLFKSEIDVSRAIMAW
jgi:hypothetical protein